MLVAIFNLTLFLASLSLQHAWRVVSFSKVSIFMIISLLLPHCALFVRSIVSPALTPIATFVATYFCSALLFLLLDPTFSHHFLPSCPLSLFLTLLLATLSYVVQAFIYFLNHTNPLTVSSVSPFIAASFLIFLPQYLSLVLLLVLILPPSHFLPDPQLPFSSSLTLYLFPARHTDYPPCT